MFHSAINTLVTDGHNAGYKYPRIGLTDRGKVGKWRFMNGDSYDPHDKTPHFIGDPTSRAIQGRSIAPASPTIYPCGGSSHLVALFCC